MNEPKRLRVLFGDKPQWREMLFRAADPLRYDVAMQDLASARLADHDLVVPLMIADHEWLDRSGQGLPAIPVPAAVRQLCDDKPQLNQRLIDLGFGDHVPRMLDRLPDNLVAEPVIVKPRVGGWGADSVVLARGQVGGQVASWLRSGSHFVQSLVAGRHEMATHVLMHRGQPALWATVEYDMGFSHRVKGVTAREQHRSWLRETPAQALWLRMLQAIGFSDGTCCIDYRIADGRPMLFEINPRFGFSLMDRLNPYLDAYGACVAAQGSK